MLAAPLLGLVASGSTTVTQVPDPDMVSPGFLGFVVVFLLAVATILLVRSMTKHLRKVRYSPEPGGTGASSAPGTSPTKAPPVS